MVGNLKNIITNIRKPQGIKENKVILNALFLYASPVIMGLLSFIFWLIVSRFINAEDVGIITTLINIAAVITILSLMGINSVIIRILPNIKNKEAFVGTSILVVVVTSIIISSVAYGFVRSSSLSVNIIMYVTMAMIATVSSINTIVDSYFTGNSTPKYSLIKNITFSIVKLVLLAILYVWATRYSVLCVLLVSILIGFLTSLYYLKKVGIKKLIISTEVLSIFKNNWLFALSNYIAHSLHHGCVLLMPVVVTMLVGGEFGAYFYIAWMFVMQLYFASDSISMSLFAEGSDDIENFRKQMTKCFKLITIINIVGIIVLVGVGKYILWIFGEAYSVQGYHTLIILTVASLPFSIIVMYKAILRVNKNVVELSLTWIALMAIAFVGSAYFVPKYGINGASLSWLCGNILVASYIIIKNKGLLFFKGISKK
jgi:O-antigen/teichoic acid export membrane protein